MSNKTTPKIIFVDGFNTVGKDHFIDELQKALPGRTLVTDPRIWLPSFQSSKRYWDFVYRTPEENTAIFNAHLKHLSRLRELLDEPHTRDLILVTNRSFVSPLNYNYLPSQFNGRTIGGNDEMRQSYLGVYKNIIQTVLSDTPTLMVNLDRFHDIAEPSSRFENITALRRRMHAREPGLLMNDFYLDYLIHNYQNPCEEVKQLYSHWENTHSGKAGEIVAKYFSH